MLPDAPAIVALHGRAAVLTTDGELLTLSRAGAAELLQGGPPLVVHAPSTLRRLGHRPMPCFDLLELFAFVLPARTVAPVVTVAAAPIRAPASVPGIGEAVAAHAAAARSVQQAGWRAPPGAPALAAQPAAMAGGYAPGFPGMQQAGGQQAMAQPMAAQSALGGARTALPPPVPYGAQPR